MPRIRLVRVAVASAPEDLSICDIAGRRLRLKARGSKFQLRCVLARASRPCESCDQHTGETPVPLPSARTTISGNSSVAFPRHPAAPPRTGGLQFFAEALTG